jgi:hypothetical protein
MTDVESKDKLGLLYVFIGIVVVLWSANLLFFLPYIKELKFQGAGEVGDIFGAANSLFSGLAMAGIIFTILLQKKELKLQREELKATRDEFVQQNSTLKLQRFENTFFQMLKLHQDNISNLYIKHKDWNPEYSKFSNSKVPEKIYVEKKGKEVFRYFVNVLKDLFGDFDWPEGAEFKPNEEIIETQRNIINEHFFTFDFDNGRYLSSYFDTVTEILNFVIHNKELKFHEQQFYLNILKAQLSEDEQFLLMYYAMSDYPGSKIRTTVAKYNLLTKTYLIISHYHDEVFKHYVLLGKK